MPDKKNITRKSGAKKPAAAKSAAAKSSAGESAARKPAAGKPAARKPTASKAAGAKAAGTKPAARKPAASKPAPAKSASPEAAATPAPAEANPLHKKLRLRPEDKGLVVAPPPEEDNPLLPLPAGFTVVDQPGELAAQTGPFDYIHVFARERVELAETLSVLSQSLAPGGSLWISWMKPSSKLKGGGQPGDLNETIVRRIGLTRGFVDMNLASLDRDWGALRLMRRR